MTSKQDLLIEIGTEELPPKNLKNLMQTFAANFENELIQTNFEFDSIEAFATPRRLAIRVSKLAAEQPTQAIEKRGPALAAAMDESGQPTKAALGFIRSCGLQSIDQLEQLETKKGTWLVHRDNKPGESLASLIETLINKALKDLPIERRMRWGAKRHEFVRPVHWLIVLHGNDVLPCSVFGVGSGRTSRGHRFMSKGEFDIKCPQDYLDQLKDQHVIADFFARRGLISEQLAEIAEKESANVEIDQDLLDEVTALVEWPVALMGRFPDEFLMVPVEALVSAMKEHQRYFHMTNNEGHMLARFITIANIISKNADVVVAGNEKVILPRLTDARFFFDQDKKTTLEDKRQRLSSVVFQSELGTYFDKTKRIGELTSYLAETLGANTKDALRAGELCKSDLVSDMVGEFPDLQGTMGGYYAEFEEETPTVVSAIAEHYLPKSSGGSVPRSVEAKCVAIADKLDTLTGMFGIGQPPTGSKDPFALRRQTLGVIRMCIEGELDFELNAAIGQAISIHGQTFDSKPVNEYVVERLKNWYQDQNIRFDSVDSVVTIPGWNGNLHQTHNTILALEEFRSTDQAEALISANKRVANILKKQSLEGVGEVDPSLFAEKAEHSLFALVTEVSKKIDDLQDSSEQLVLLGSLREEIDQYFDNVMVMSEDDVLKRNRIATLAVMRSLFLRVADISLLQQ